MMSFKAALHTLALLTWCMRWIGGNVFTAGKSGGS